MVLVTGDGDLAPAVRRIRSMHKSIEVASFDDPSKKEFAWTLKNAADRRINLTANIDKFKI
ncbi:hypothetical protein A3K80_00300 [Candidatus Bathyarchaeota archaeon RBG_13_38_9]|nr:MAG: hypothetical protein A3K80_00300 [Candidatus Bathyarchaeota archaeon RBG_13_38_9]